MLVSKEPYIFTRNNQYQSNNITFTRKIFKDFPKHSLHTNHMVYKPSISISRHTYKQFYTKDRMSFSYLRYAKR